MLNVYPTMTNDTPIAVFWFRRDLRLEDNAGLYHALKSGLPVLPLFIFDSNILDKLSNKADARVNFIYTELLRLNSELNNIGSALLVKHGKPEEVWAELLLQYNISSVFTNEDYEPYALERDARVAAMLNKKNATFNAFKDHVIFRYTEVLKDDGKPYTVYTPYSRKWKQRLTPFHYKSYPTLKYREAFYRTESGAIPSLAEIGFEQSSLIIPKRVVKSEVIKQYTQQRDYPAIDGTSRLGLHLRFGTLSIRVLLAYAIERNTTFVNELIWRDFYQQILAHYPHVSQKAFKPEYDNILWRNNEVEFAAWCKGETGYPLVDAGMRELNATGYMHNRVRMVVASFLTKHLLIDWRWGEAYFAEKLLDFDLAANNGGWQWAAGSGTDAAPYFRVFNPQLQMEKFDPDLKYVKHWIPEYGTPAYKSPIVVHHEARERCLLTYGAALKKL